MNKKTEAKIFLDMDGVLADFDTGAGHLLGTDDIHKWEFVHGPKEFWKRLDSYPNFFGSLPVMEGAYGLWAEVVHKEPIILTALPKVGATDVDKQKREWVSKYLHANYEVDVITCQTHEKPGFCNEGDVLVDDRAVNREAWEAKGGKFILHTSAESSLTQLKALGYI
jgi:5'(3')-deoxyribonucleotidase